MAKTKLADQTARELQQQVWSLEDQHDGAAEGADISDVMELLTEKREKLEAHQEAKEQKRAKKQGTKDNPADVAQDKSPKVVSAAGSAKGTSSA